MSYGTKDLFVVAADIRDRATNGGWMLTDAEILGLAVKQQFNELYADANVINTLGYPVALEKIAMGLAGDSTSGIAGGLYAISHSMDSLAEQVANLQELQVKLFKK